MQKHLFGIAFLVVWVFIPCVSAENNTLTTQEKYKGWELLFDGKTFKGWRNYRAKGVRDGWKVLDGTMHHTKKGGDLITNKMYGDFVLKLDWKISKGGNSGIFLGVRESKRPIYHTGIEMQIIDNAAHPDAQHAKHVAGACYGLYKPPVGASKNAGEWNQVKIVKQGDHYQFFLNEVKTADFRTGSEAFKKRVAASKFKQWKNFAKHQVGHIGLQDHGDEVSFKNIKILELDE